MQGLATCSHVSCDGTCRRFGSPAISGERGRDMRKDFDSYPFYTKSPERRPRDRPPPSDSSSSSHPDFAQHYQPRDQRDRREHRPHHRDERHHGHHSHRHPEYSSPAGPPVSPPRVAPPPRPSSPPPLEPDYEPYEPTQAYYPPSHQQPGYSSPPPPRGYHGASNGGHHGNPRHNRQLGSPAYTEYNNQEYPPHHHHDHRDPHDHHHHHRDHHHGGNPSGRPQSPVSAGRADLGNFRPNSPNVHTRKNMLYSHPNGADPPNLSHNHTPDDVAEWWAAKCGHVSCDGIFCRRFPSYCEWQDEGERPTSPFQAARSPRPGEYSPMEQHSNNYEYWRDDLRV